MVLAQTNGLLARALNLEMCSRVQGWAERNKNSSELAVASASMIQKIFVISSVRAGVKIPALFALINAIYQ